MITALEHQGRRLLQIGIIFLLFASFEGFAIPYFAAPKLGLSVHTLSALLSVLLIAMGLLWPKLNLSITLLKIAFGFLIYSAVSIDAAYMMAAIWGAGYETMHLAATTFHGNPLQEHIIMITAYSSAPTGIISFVLILWGLCK